jgi:hypothetical protein
LEAGSARRRERVQTFADKPELLHLWVDRAVLLIVAGIAIALGAGSLLVAATRMGVDGAGVDVFVVAYSLVLSAFLCLAAFLALDLSRTVRDVTGVMRRRADPSDDISEGGSLQPVE